MIEVPQCIPDGGEVNKEFIDRGDDSPGQGRLFAERSLVDTLWLLF
jgi:hypothetical protein